MYFIFFLFSYMFCFFLLSISYILFFLLFFSHFSFFISNIFCFYHLQKMPGVVKVITAKDIPGQNNFSMAPILPEEVSTP